MNVIEVDFHDEQYAFILPQGMASEVEYIQIADKEVRFTQTILDQDRTGYNIDVEETFPTDIFYEVVLLDKDYQVVSYLVQDQGMVPFYGDLPGVFLFEKQQMYIKFLHVNDIMMDMSQAPILYEKVLNINEEEVYTSIAIKQAVVNSYRNILLIANQTETGIKHIIPVQFDKNEIYVVNKFMSGLFSIEMIFFTGDHTFQVSFSTEENDYAPLLAQTKKLRRNEVNKLSLERVMDDTITLYLENINTIEKVELFTNKKYQSVFANQTSGTIELNYQEINKAPKAALLLMTEEGILIEDLKQGVLKQNGIAQNYQDRTIYNFHTGFLANKENLHVENIQVDDTLLTFQIKQDKVDKFTSDVPFLLVKLRKSSHVNYIRGERHNQSFIFDFSFLLDLIENQNAARWDLFLINDAKSTISYRLGYFEENILEKPKRFFVPFRQTFENNSTYKQYTRVYITQNNELAMVKNNLSNLIKEEFNLKASVVRFYMKKNKIDMSINVISPYQSDFQLGSFYLIQRNKDTIDKRHFPIQDVDQFNGKAVVTTTIDLLEAELYPLYWDLYIGIIANDQEYFVKINSVAKKIIWDVNETISKYQFNVNNQDIIYPYITLGNDLSFTYREKEYYENRYYLLKENLAFLFVKLFRKHFEKRDIWLAFEKLAISAHDSGYYFFDYVYKNQKHDEFYYIIQKNSPEINNLKDKKDKVIYFMSFKYFIYMFAAQLLISSDTKRNSYNLKLKKSRLAKVLTDKKLVYLQHGVNGLKRVRDFHKDREVFDLVIAPSEFEKDMIINDWGYDETEVEATGLARWDGLKDKTEEIEYKQIFLMPTWRTWMDGMEKSKFIESEYFQKYNEFLSSKKLHEMLERNNVKIKFFLHPKFRDYIDLFDTNSPNIEKFGFLETPMDEMIMKSSLMISDYSSVIWEMFYLKKPCVFFQFDKDKYLEYEGAYMDLDNDLFGDVAYQTEDLLKIIEDYIDNDFEEKQKFAELRNDYFTYMDHRNSERIYEAIQANEDWLIEPLDLPRFKLSHIIPFGIRRKLLDIKNRILG